VPVAVPPQRFQVGEQVSTAGGRAAWVNPAAAWCRWASAAPAARAWPVLRYGVHDIASRYRSMPAATSCTSYTKSPRATVVRPEAVCQTAGTDRPRPRRCAANACSAASWPAERTRVWWRLTKTVPSPWRTSPAADIGRGLLQATTVPAPVAPPVAHPA
jgi:hypothetical protein